MSAVSKIGHMAMRVSDLDRAVEFQSEVMGLVETERQGGTSFMTCNDRHHELILIQSGTRGYDHIGLEVATAEDLEAVRAQAAAAGGDVLTQIQEGETGIDRCFFVRSPAGHVFKIFLGMEKVAEPEPGDRPSQFEHVSTKALRMGREERFLSEGLGFRFSDRLGRTASWWHCDPDHHGMAVVIAPRAELSHYAWSLEDLNALGRTADRLRARGQRAIWGPSRHGPGNNLFLYFHDADGAMIECCAELEKMPPEGDYKPRKWTGGMKDINQWGSTPPAKFLLTGFPINHREGEVK